MSKQPAPLGTVLREDYEEVVALLAEQKRINEFDRVVPIQELREDLDRAETARMAEAEVATAQLIQKQNLIASLTTERDEALADMERFRRTGQLHEAQRDEALAALREEREGLARAKGLAQAIAQARPYPVEIDGVRGVAAEIVTLIDAALSNQEKPE